MIKYSVKFSRHFKRQLKKISRQGKDLDKLFKVIELLSKGVHLDRKYNDHALLNNKYYRECRECHIEPDWLLVYKYSNQELILFLIETGSHSDLFNK